MLETLLQPNDETERCGLILKDGQVIEIANIAEDPANSYEMDPSQVLPHIDEVVGTWHTHPKSDPVLSGEDYKGFLAWPDWGHAIIGIRNGQPAVERYVVEDGVVISCA